VLSDIVGNFTEDELTGTGEYKECSMTKQTRESTVIHDMLKQFAVIFLSFPKLTVHRVLS